MRVLRLKDVQEYGRHRHHRVASQTACVGTISLWSIIRCQPLALGDNELSPPQLGGGGTKYA